MTYPDVDPRERRLTWEVGARMNAPIENRNERSMLCVVDLLTH